MGRYFYDKKSTVNEYKSISVKKLKAWDYFAQGYKCGTLTWSSGGAQVGSIGISVYISGREGFMRLNYVCDKTDSLDYKVQLVSTPCHFGGFRWWFICPLSRRGIHCGRRVGVLYLSKYAGCRDCYDLTYQTCQDSHKWDALAKSMGFSSDKYLKRVFKW